MKKVVTFLIMAMLISSISLTAFASQPEISIPKAKTAPVVDGIINAGEYTFTSTYTGTDSTPWSSSGVNAKSRKVEFYAAWDDANFYVAVVADCAPEHVQIYDNDAENYIYNAHHLMSAATATTPTEEKYKPEDGKAWDWGVAYESGLGHEWSIALKSTDNTLVDENHFGAAVDFPYVVKSADGKDVYEQAIPWSYIDTEGENKFEIGAKFGFAFTVGVGDASSDIEKGVEPAGDYVNFANGINDYKNFAEYSIVTLVDEVAAVEEPTEETKENPITSDTTFVMFALIAAASVSIIVLSKKVRKA